jgi:pterin-4a-carbinolamine dehydratase/catechol 2,3-dioxygenase-like lactoylglutathione lyase family enzyme
VHYTAVTADEFANLPGLADWRWLDTSIHARFRAPSYAAGADLLPAIAAAADTLVHHPDVELRYPGVVHVVLKTHATGGITTLDIDLAHDLNACCGCRRCPADGGAVATPITIGLNHVATLTASMDTTVRFYERAFGAVVTFELAKRDDHPWMKILDLGGGAALNVFEVPAEEIIGQRRTQGARGAIDHFALAVGSRATLEAVRERLLQSDAQEVGTIQQLGHELSLFFRDPDGMELEVCCPA